jgi:hypothetical protein
MVIDTRVSGALHETIVDEGLVKSFVPDARRLANSIYAFF